jgi:hypothetical protein
MLAEPPEPPDEHPDCETTASTTQPAAKAAAQSDRTLLRSDRTADATEIGRAAAMIRYSIS